MIDKLIIFTPTDPYNGSSDMFERTEETSDMDLTKVDNIEFDDVDYRDAPNFSDAYICSADYDGEPMTEEELNDFNYKYTDFVHEKLIEKL